MGLHVLELWCPGPGPRQQWGFPLWQCLVLVLAAQGHCCLSCLPRQHLPLADPFSSSICVHVLGFEPATLEGPPASCCAPRFPSSPLSLPPLFPLLPPSPSPACPQVWRGVPALSKDCPVLSSHSGPVPTADHQGTGRLLQWSWAVPTVPSGVGQRGPQGRLGERGMAPPPIRHVSSWCQGLGTRPLKGLDSLLLQPKPPPPVCRHNWALAAGTGPAARGCPASPTRPRARGSALSWVRARGPAVRARPSASVVSSPTHEPRPARLPSPVGPPSKARFWFREPAPPQAQGLPVCSWGCWCFCVRRSCVLCCPGPDPLVRPGAR